MERGGLPGGTLAVLVAAAIALTATIVLGPAAPARAMATVAAHSGRDRVGLTRSARAPRRPTLRLANSMAGPLLVNRGGRTVFMFTRERRRRDLCAHIRNCLRDWPAVTTVGRPVAGRGLRRALLGTIPFRGRLRQVTYAGHPLHTYRFDYGRASMMAIGNHQFGGSWFALEAGGRILR